MDFSQLDTSRSTEYEVDKRKLYGLKAYSKALQAHGKSRSMVFPMKTGLINVSCTSRQTTHNRPP